MTRSSPAHPDPVHVAHGSSDAPGSVAADVALVSTFAAFMAACSLITFNVGIVPVPITLQTFAVLLTGAVLGPRRALLSVGLYLLVGLIGFPVFAGGQGGIGALASPSVGYLLSFPFAAMLVGVVSRRLSRQGRPGVGALIVAASVATLVTYLIGVPVMAWRTDMSVSAAAVFNLTFVPADCIKLVLAAVTGAAVLRAFPHLRRP